MEQLIEIINANILYAPYIIFGALILAGFNIPVSEDAMLFISAILAKSHPEKLSLFFICVFAGAYLSDLICYGLGRALGPKLFQIKLFKSMVSPKKLEKINHYYETKGIITLLLGRFIPFGVRNALFLSAGLSKMNFTKFALSDLVACIISNVFFFTLYYNYGMKVVEYVKKGNIILFSFAACSILIYFLVKKKRKQVKLSD